jgi:hypothetical protein
MRISDYMVTICYGKSERWYDREEAKKHFLEAINNSEGSEQRRYENVYLKLCAGEMLCTDED